MTTAVNSIEDLTLGEKLDTFIPDYYATQLAINDAYLLCGGHGRLLGFERSPMDSRLRGNDRYARSPLRARRLS